MLIIPQLQIPSSIKSLLTDILALDSLGVRFIDERRFRTEVLKQIEIIFTTAESKGRAEILFFLRECSRSLCVLPALLPTDCGKVPLLTIAKISSDQLNQLAISCSQNDLALPAFEISESSKQEDLFLIAKALFFVEYRGPVFLAKKDEIESRLKENGVLNQVPADCEHILDLSLTNVIESLKKLQWYRNRILALSNPWMFAGITL